MWLPVLTLFCYCWCCLIIGLAQGENHGSNFPYGRKVFEVGEEILCQVCDPIPTSAIVNHDSDLMEAASNAHMVLSNFRSKMGFGRALAAPQVGYKMRFVVMQRTLSPDQPPQPRTLYNPSIIDHSEETFTMWDDCLSFPDRLCRVRRFKWVSVRFDNEEGREEVWDHCPQDLSELLQHELDHLDGVLALDKAEEVVLRDDFARERNAYEERVDFHY